MPELVCDRRTARFGPSRILVCWMLALIACLASGPAGAASAETLFQRGVEAAQADDYERAIEAFVAAREAGMDTGALHYNLGTAYYGAGDMEAARAAFRRAWESATMRAPAAYMLGRLARRRGDSAAARKWFERARDTASTSAVRQRAANALEEPSDPGPRGFAYAAVGAAYDSNVAASPPDVADSVDTADSALRVSAAARRPLGGALELVGGLYLERYADLDRCDYTALRGGGAWQETLGAPWRLALEGRLRHERLGGDTLRNAVVLSTGMDRRGGERRRLRFNYELTLYDGGKDFGFLDGQRHRLEASAPASGSGWTGSAALERMQRSDQDAGDDFQSFSWSAAEVALGYRFNLGSDVRLDLGGDLSLRDYDETEVRNGDRLGSREDDLAGIEAEASGALGNGLSWLVRLRREERQSNIDAFDYERNLLVAYVEASF